MKRVVQCPKCETKLSVFDSGKPINQKCPKCRESFVVESEEAKSAGADKPADATAVPAAEKKADQPTDAKLEAKAEDKGDAKPADSKVEAKPDVKAEEKTEGKADASAAKETPKKSFAKSAAAQPKSTPSADAGAPAPQHIDSGISYMDVMMILGLLVLSLIIQVVGIRKNAVRFNALDDQIQHLEAQLNTLKK